MSWAGDEGAFQDDIVFQDSSFHVCSHKFDTELNINVLIFQDFNSFSAYIQQFKKDQFLRAVSDLHVLIFMATCDMLPIKVSCT